MAPRLPPTSSLPICTACGTLYPAGAHDPPPLSCRICEDPRQFIPPLGQSWTTLQEMRESGRYKNVWKEEEWGSGKVWSLWTDEKFAIGQRAILVKTAKGLIMWDCIAYFDEETIEKINSLGPLLSITISHPHYYTTSSLWASAFDCPIYTAAEDSEWINHIPGMQAIERRFIEPGKEAEEIVKEGASVVTALKLGGHFDGSLVLHVELGDGGGRLFVADTFVTVPSALSPPESHPPTTPAGPSQLRTATSYTFMYSIPNMIPLPPTSIAHMWRIMRPFDFISTHGAFVGQDVLQDAQDGRDGGASSEEVAESETGTGTGTGAGGASGVKRRVLESMKIQVRAEGWESHEFLAEEL